MSVKGRHMRVVLAGFNIEAEMVERLEKSLGVSVTPEVISAAYARVTRDPRKVATLRREARREVKSARASNERIVFGLGHSSIAEHAVFNFDIMDVSRLAVEEIEHFRLASYTEKSQRYIRLGRDIVMPDEVREAGLDRDFGRLMNRLHEGYEELCERLLAFGVKEGKAKEDARYIMPLATAAQLGMTLNARELEYMVSRLAAHPLSELRELSRELSRAATRIAPSLVKYPEPTDYFRDMHEARKELAYRQGARREPKVLVRLIDATEDADVRIAACIIFSSGGATMGEATRKAARMGVRGRTDLIKRTLSRIASHDSVWREFESVQFLFEVVVSASCFAQLKRHRMATLIPQRYDTSLGLSVPETIRTARAVRAFREHASAARALAAAIERERPEAAAYALMNAHRRRVLMGLNLRELYHFSRLRSDRHAQWEIRELSAEMCRLAKKRVPAGAALLAGKDDFVRTKESLGL
jgi:flavin-dependent thymidylate synthase